MRACGGGARVRRLRRQCVGSVQRRSGARRRRRSFTPPSCGVRRNLACYSRRCSERLPTPRACPDAVGATSALSCPLPSVALVVAAFLFIVTSVVSAAFVLGMFSTGGDLNPSSRIKLSWGAILGALGFVMILSGSIDAIKSIIALGAIPFVFIVLLLVVCLLKMLKKERVDAE